MDINNDTLNQVFRNLKKSFADGAGEFKPGVDLSFAFQDVPSTGRSNFYAWLDSNYRGWRQWEGARDVKETSALQYELVNLPFENTVRIPVTAFEDDNSSQLAMYGDVVKGVGNGWSEMSYTWCLLGLLTNAKCFDGTAFFGTHTYGTGKTKTTVTNKIAGDFDATTFAAARDAAAAWKWPDGLPTRSMFTHVLYGPSKKSTVFNVIGKQLISNDSNVNYNAVKMVECDLFTGDYASLIILVDGSKSIKPALRQIRRPGEVIMTRDPEKVLMSGSVDVLGYGRGAYGVSFPHLAYGFNIA